MDDTLRRLIVSMNMGAIPFDAELQVGDPLHMPPWIQAVLGKVRRRMSVTGLFPEFIGSEADLREVMAGGRSDLCLDNINREDKAGEPRYWDLRVLFVAETGGGLILVQDVTRRARTVQELNQMRYEDILYRGRLRRNRKAAGKRLLGNAPAMDRLRSDIDKLRRAPSATVLLQGETGTGKSHVARIIHVRSNPPEAPFVEVNCAALPENLIESELFGYEKGAFTHAAQQRKGLLEEAEGGTVFLDEIGELPVGLQAKLLTVIETKTIRRLGGNVQIPFRSRIIAATNRDLAEEIKARRFRQDLFFRLNVATLTLPPLRELGDDILLLAEHFIGVFNLEFKKRVSGLSRKGEKALLAYPWPGNVRELSNCIERAMIFAEDGPLTPVDMVPVPSADGDGAPLPWRLPPEGLVLDEVERHLLQSAMERTGGNKTRAAALLGLTRDTLRYRLEKFGIG